MRDDNLTYVPYAIGRYGNGFKCGKCYTGNIKRDQWRRQRCKICGAMNARTRGL